MREVSLEVAIGPDGFPASAVAHARVESPLEKVWSQVVDLERYPGRIPMVHKVTRDGDRVTIHLKFKLPLFSVGFHFTAEVRADEGRWLEVKWVEGEPRDFLIRFELAPDGDAATQVRARAALDVLSLGWLVKYFLKSHPELRFGVIPGVALALLHSVQPT